MSVTEEGVRVVGVDETPAPKEPRRRGRRHGRSLAVGDGAERGGWLISVLATVAVAGVAGTVAFGVAWYHDHSQASDQAAARTQAEHFVYDLTNFDAKSVNADFSSIQGMATGQFATQAQNFFNGSIRQQLQAAQASTRGQVQYMYLQSYGNGKASFYALDDQTYANSKTQGPQTDQLRLIIDEQKVNGTWKIADLTELSGPAVGSGAGG